MDWGHLGQWAAETPPEDAVVAVARLVGLAAAYWLLVSTTLYCVARASRIPALMSGVGWMALPGMRRLVDGAVAASIMGGAVFGGGVAHAAEQPLPPPLVQQVGQTVEAASGVHVYVPVPAGDPTVAPTTTTTTGPPAPSTTSTAPPTTRRRLRRRAPEAAGARVGRERSDATASRCRPPRRSKP